MQSKIQCGSAQHLRKSTRQTVGCSLEKEIGKERGGSLKRVLCGKIQPYFCIFLGKIGQAKHNIPKVHFRYVRQYCAHLCLNQCFVYLIRLLLGPCGPYGTPNLTSWHCFQYKKLVWATSKLDQTTSQVVKIPHFQVKSRVTLRGNIKAARSVNHRGLPGGGRLWLCMRRPQQLYGPRGMSVLQTTCVGAAFLRC